MAARHWALGVGALLVLAAIDGNITHWSTPVGDAAAAPTSEAPAAEVKVEDTWSLPVPAVALTDEVLDKPHHDYPALDIPAATGTPVWAVRGGRVELIDDDRCGIGVRVNSPDGAEWTYCHGSTRQVEAGTTVQAGRQLLAAGSSGNSSGPHLHLQIRAGGRLRCPHPLIASLHKRHTPLDPNALPDSGCTS